MRGESGFYFLLDIEYTGPKSWVTELVFRSEVEVEVQILLGYFPPVSGPYSMDSTGHSRDFKESRVR